MCEKLLYTTLITVLWWVPSIVSEKWLNVDVFSNNFFITYSFVIFFLLIINFTSIRMQIPGVNINADKLGRKFKMSQNKGGVAKSYEFYYDSEEEFKKLVKYLKDIVE